MKGGIFIPIDDFIIHILNIDKDDIESLKTSINGDEVIYEIKLKRKEMYCDYCHEKMIGHGVKKERYLIPISEDMMVLFTILPTDIYVNTAIRLNLKITHLHLTDLIIHTPRLKK